MISNEHFKGSIHSIILFLLSEQPELYGYEITQMVKSKTKDAIHFTEGAIYPALHKLERKGFIDSRKDHINGRVRKYYRITAKGVKENQKQILSLNAFFKALSGIFGHHLQTQSENA